MHVTMESVDFLNESEVGESNVSTTSHSFMKNTSRKNIYRKINRARYSLGDLARIVQSCSKNSTEATAVLAHLLGSGRVLLGSAQNKKQVTVAG
jgi:hypothetical protein